jgi:cytochrome b
MDHNNSIKVWDIAVRVFHWSLALAFTVAWLSEDDFEDLHVIAGYTVLGLICFRVVWGFIGPQYARFSDFIYSPAEIKQYLKGLMRANPKHYFGHNPAGGVMVILLLVSLFGTTLTGLKIYGVKGYGPLAQSENASSPAAIIPAAISPVTNAYADDDKNGEKENPAEEFWEGTHEVFSNIALFLVIFHILGVLFSSMMENENLVKAMINGRKKIPPNDTD